MAAVWVITLHKLTYLIASNSVTKPRKIETGHFSGLDEHGSCFCESTRIKLRAHWNYITDGTCFELCPVERAPATFEKASNTSEYKLGLPWKKACRTWTPRMARLKWSRYCPLKYRDINTVGINPRGNIWRGKCARGRVGTGVSIY